MHTQALVEKACALQPGNADYLAELGYQCILQNKTKEAAKHYRAALKADEASITALNGMPSTPLVASTKRNSQHR